uniref:Pseudouridine synthase n=1 Tax=Candidatus Aschnera chinzeii TaxID=1485666 RepID=A0AAT9G5D2_9ENTR|nr:MAG: 23S rRNA pseudouridine(955/2504/2580) synthase RluC [Candidatus Aschnera chinzeii]
MQTKNKIHIIKVNNEQSGRRIDNFLFTIYKKLSKIIIYCLIRKGKIIINNKKTYPSYKIQFNDVIQIKSLKYDKQIQNNNFSNNTINSSTLNSWILYEDEFLMILNKPTGISVHGGSGISFGIIELLRKIRSNIRFLGLAHRLDRNTSGNLIISKKYSVLRLLNQQFFLQQIQKEYLALVQGIWPTNIQTIKAPLLKNTLKNGERIVKVANNGKYAESHFQIKEYFSDATLVKVNTTTGRTHQIRVHTQHINHPIIGDERYGNYKFNRELMRIGFKRLFLHAQSLTFVHPITNKLITINAPLDKEFITYLKLLRNNKL